MTINDVIYVNVGQKGADCWSGESGLAYNGGGHPGPYGCSGAGGGATHIAYTEGMLIDYKNKMGDVVPAIMTKRSDELIMVAGAGGGGGGRSSGGSGGGFRGNDGNDVNYGGTGGTQLTYGSGISPGAFGHGGNRTSGDGGGGGAGLYGGGAGFADYGGGGGSGYIGNENLKSVYGYEKHMTCYHCEEATQTGTSEIRTYSTSNYSSDALTDHAKRGNGYARITYLDLSENKYLSDIQVLQPTTQDVIPFDKIEEFYNIYL